MASQNKIRVICNVLEKITGLETIEEKYKKVSKQDVLHPRIAEHRDINRIRI